MSTGIERGSLLGSGDTQAMSALLAKNWWLIALRAAFGIIFGIVAFVWPVATILSLVFVFAAYMLIDGVLAIAAAVRAARAHERWGLLILEGIANLAAAAIAVVWPGITVLVFIVLLAVWSIVSGVLMLIAAFRLRADHGRGWLAVGGIASIVFGGALIVAPLIGAIVLTWWIGAYALIFGIALLILAFRLRSHHAGTAGGAAPRPA